MDWGRERAFLENGPSLPQTLPAWFAPLLPPEIFDRREGRTTEIPLDAGEKIKSIGISVLCFQPTASFGRKAYGQKGRQAAKRLFCFLRGKDGREGTD